MWSQALLFLAMAGTFAGAEDQLRIGSWNIQNLGERAWGQHPKALAQHLWLAGLDLLVLQEIHETDGVPQRMGNKKLDEVFRLLNARSQAEWTYRLLPKNDPKDGRRLCAVAWNRKRVRLVGAPLRIAFKEADREVWRRPPYALKFSAGEGRSDFVLIPLHMKSNHDGAERARRMRAREARALAAVLPHLRRVFEDRDIILAGDTNSLSPDEESLAIFRRAGLNDLNAAGAATYVDGKASLDRFLVASEQAEFKFSRQYALTPADRRRHAGKLSDHYLILMAVRILEDDDPPPERPQTDVSHSPQ